MPGADSRTAGVTRGVARLLEDLGCEWLAEFKLATGRRVDLIGLIRISGFSQLTDSILPIYSVAC